jgi:AraC-like DNA-binding protein
MLSVPLPFLVSLLLLVMAIGLFLSRAKRNSLATLFLLMCAGSTALAGVRWMLDWAFLQTLQPIVASGIPVIAWYAFTRARDGQTLTWRHAVAPAAITLSSLTAYWWTPPLDLMLTGLFTFYGIALCRSALGSQRETLNISLTEVSRARLTTWLAGSALLFSAAVDGAVTLDFLLWGGTHALFIINMGHVVLIPTLAMAVIWISLHTQVDTQLKDRPTCLEQAGAGVEKRSDEAIYDDAPQIMMKLEAVVTEQQLYLDTNLTLAKLARKSGVPSRLISNAVNKTCQLNVSQWINRYRIQYAKHLLATTVLPVTVIYLDAGFQTKSNFHREFSRQVGCTPSAYRKEHTISANDVQDTVANN